VIVIDPPENAVRFPMLNFTVTVPFGFGIIADAGMEAQT
jgi:hypothetical protein